MFIFCQICKMNNILTNKDIDVVHLHSYSDLILETNTQIRFSTSNILIDYIPFDQYIRDVVFAEGYTRIAESSLNDNSWLYSVILNPPTSPPTLVDLTGKDGEMIVDEIHTSGISATHSHIANAYHYINLSAEENIYFVNNTNSENITFKKYTVTDQLTSLSNYVYEVLNGNFMPELDVDIIPSITSGTQDITNLGTYVGNKITTERLSTTDVKVGGSEPILNFDSMTGINMMSSLNSGIDVGSNIMIGSVNLLELIKSQLDETSDSFGSKVFYFGMNIQSGIEITINFNNDYGGYGFSNAIFGDKFNYDIFFHMHLQTSTEIAIDNSVSTNTYTDASQTNTISSNNIVFNGLTTGQTYKLYANVINKRTGTIVYNILISENIPTIPRISIVSVTVVNEKQIRIVFTPHAITGISEIVDFMFQLDWVGRTGNIVEVDTSYDQNLNNSIPGGNYTYFFDFPSTNDGSKYNTSYGRSYLNIGVDTTFIIKSLPYNMTSELNLSSSELSAPFSLPSSPRNLNISHLSGYSYTFNWTQSTNFGGTTTVSYKVIDPSGVIKADNITSTSTTIYLGSYITNGFWRVASYNVYYDSTTQSTTNDANSYQVISPTISTTGITSNGHKTFNITYNVTFNNSYNITGTNIVTANNRTGTSGSVNTNVINSIGQINFTLEIEDTLNFQRVNSNPQSITTANPSLSISGFAISATNNNYSLTINSASANVSSGGYTIYVQIRNSAGNVVQTLTYTNTGSKSGNYNFSYNTTYFLYAYIENAWGYSTSYSSYGNSSEAGSAPSGSITIGTISWDNGTNTFTLSSISGSISAIPSPTYSLWYQNSEVKNLGSSLPSSTSHNIGTLTVENHSFYIKATNILGSKNGTAKPITITQPKLTSSSFTGFSGSPPTPTYTATPATGISLVGSIVMTPTPSFSGAKTYTLKGTYANNQYGLQKEITIGTFPATAPTNPSITSATSVSYDSMTINYDLGNNGTPSITPTITLYYGTFEDSTDNSTELVLPEDASSKEITGLLVGTRYYFKMEKDYDHYNTISSTSPFDKETLDYQYDSEELADSTSSDVLLGISVSYNRLSISLVHVYETTYLNETITRISHFYRQMSYPVRTRDNPPTQNFVQDYESLKVTHPERILRLEKGTGNNVFYIIFGNKYLRYNRNYVNTNYGVGFISDKLSLTDTKDEYCEFVIEPLPFTYDSDHWFADTALSYYDKSRHRYLEETDLDKRPYREYYQAFSIKTKETNYYLFHHQDFYTYLYVSHLDHIATVINNKPVNTSHIKEEKTSVPVENFQFFFFKKDRIDLDQNRTYLESVRFPMSNLGKINIVFENIYLHIKGAMNNGYTTFTKIHTGTNVYNSIPVDTDIHIGPLHLREIIVIHNNDTTSHTLEVFAIKNIYDWVNEQNEKLGEHLSKHNILNERSYKIVITVQRNTYYSVQPDDIFTMEPGWSTDVRYSNGNGLGGYNYEYDPYVTIQVLNYSNSPVFTAYANNFSRIAERPNFENRRYNDTKEKIFGWDYH